MEAQAIALAAEVDEAPSGLHAGRNETGVVAALGHGLTALDRLDLADTTDPLSALAAFLTRQRFDLILAGRRGEGGHETGLLPYRLAAILGLPILADAVAITPGAAVETLVVDQAMAKGARRRVTIRLPAIVTVHPLAPPPRPFAYGPMRRGTIRRHPVDGSANAADLDTAEERPHRLRPKLMRQSAGQAAGANLYVDPTPEEAARLILAYLEANGIRRYGPLNDR
nr:electron transfer flavoprotein subunit beta [Jiella flava]